MVRLLLVYHNRRHQPLTHTEVIVRLRPETTMDVVSVSPTIARARSLLRGIDFDLNSRLEAAGPDTFRWVPMAGDPSVGVQPLPPLRWSNESFEQGPALSDDTDTLGGDDDEEESKAVELETVQSRDPPTEVGDMVRALVPIPHFQKLLVLPSGTIGRVVVLASAARFSSGQQPAERPVRWARVDFGASGCFKAPVGWLEKSRL